jgi:hypothetical protein
MAEAPSRYCTNCGHELSPEDQFCPNCGTPVHRAARVPTPEADVPVPPPPQARGAGAAAPGQPAQQAGWGRRHPLLTGCLVIIGLFVVVIILAAALSGGGDESAGGGGNEQAQNQGQGQNQAPQRDQAQNQGQKQRRDQGQGARGPASIGERVVVGDIAYTVTRAIQETRLEDPSGFDRPRQGNFVVVDFTVENLGEDPISVTDIGLYIYDDQGRQYETETDVPFGYIPENKDLFLLDRINPGLSQNVRVVFTVPPDARGLELEVSSGFFATETRRIALGF